MKAAVLYHPGGPDNFVLEERPIPAVQPGWVLVKIKAFGLNRSELMTRKGLSPDVRFPRVLGIECVGEVVDDPSGQLEPGQKVAAFMGGMGRDFDGSYAEYAVLPKDLLSPFTSHLDWNVLGALPEMFQTVYGSLHRALKIRADQTILVRGGTSSVGMLAIQMAKQSGLRVLATTRSQEKAILLLEKGADQVLIDDGRLKPKLRSIYPDGVDHILELIGTATLKDSLRCVAPGGAVCMTGMLAEQWSVPDFAPMEFIPATVQLTIYDSGQIRIGLEHFRRFILDIESGVIIPGIGRTFALAEIADAHRLMEANSAGGKIVILNED